MSTSKNVEKPKYLVCSNKRFRPLVIQYENEGDSNAYFAMYAQEASKGMSVNPERVLFWVCAPTRDEVLERFDAKFKDVESLIEDRLWKGTVKRLSLYYASELPLGRRH